MSKPDQPTQTELKGLKEYVFAQYWGQTVIDAADYTCETKPNFITPFDVIDADQTYGVLSLRPLSSITDDEAIEVSYMLNPAKPENQIDLQTHNGLKKMHVGIIKRLLFDGEIYSKSIWNVLNVMQYLQQQGFALPVFYKGKLYSVEELTDLGIIKIRQ